MKNKQSNIDEFIKFLTDTLGLKLYWYQKIILKTICLSSKGRYEVKKYSACESIGFSVKTYIIDDLSK